MFRSVLGRIDALDDYVGPHNARTLARILRGRDGFERIWLPSEKRLLQVTLDQERTVSSYGLSIER